MQETAEIPEMSESPIGDMDSPENANETSPKPAVVAGDPNDHPGLSWPGTLSGRTILELGQAAGPVRTTNVGFGWATATLRC